MPYAITTQRELRAEFWRQHPDASRRRIRDHGGVGTTFTTDTRCAFIEWLDAMERAGEISQALAERATLDSTANKHNMTTHTRTERNAAIEATKERPIIYTQKLTIVCRGDTEDGCSDALTEAIRRIQDGYMSGFDSTDDGGFYFKTSYDVPDDELPA